jgi:acetate kinase
MRVLVVNTGSSSLKLSLVSPDGTVHAAITVERWTGRTHVNRYGSSSTPSTASTR